MLICSYNILHTAQLIISPIVMVVFILTLDYLHKVVDFVLQLSIVHVSAWASCVHVWVCTLYLGLFMTCKTEFQHQIFSSVIRVMLLISCTPSLFQSNRVKDCMLTRRNNFPWTMTAEPFQFLAPWLSDGRTCGTQNMETSAKCESWFSDPLNWFNGGLLYWSAWWTCCLTTRQTQTFTK